LGSDTTPVDGRRGWGRRGLADPASRPLKRSDPDLLPSETTLRKTIEMLVNPLPISTPFGHEATREQIVVQSEHINMEDWQRINGGNTRLWMGI